jgi:hypothetical protein
MTPELPYDVSLAMLQNGSQKQDVSPFLSETIRERQLFEMRVGLFNSLPWLLNKS